ncbi:MAG: hypothetical protein GOV00_03430 [Candidatus Altiarchaeota archaeon]|nr:hypothetical protein [Candidatus Altiarchaeota archaeon]
MVKTKKGSATSGLLTQIKNLKSSSYVWIAAFAILMILTPLPTFKFIGSEQAADIGEDKNMVALGFGSSLGSKLLSGVISLISVPSDVEEDDVVNKVEDVITESEINLIVVSPSSCPAEICNPTWISEMLTAEFGANIRLTVIDPDETQVDEASGMTGFPMYIFDETIVQSSLYSELSGYLTKSGEFYILTTQPSVMNRAEESQKLDLFIMSQCPFGVQAATAVNELRAAIPDLDVKLWYIANDNGDGTFSSLRGQPEVEENIRQLCISDNEPDKFWEYMSCILPVSSNAGSEWENCADKAGVNKETLNECWQGEAGVQLLSQNVVLSNQLAIGSSPTFLVNGRYVLGGLPQGGADGIKGFVCILNPTLAGCEQTLSQTVAAAGACG